MPWLFMRHSKENRMTKMTRKTTNRITAPWQKSAFCENINIFASNKLLLWLDSFVLLNPLLRQAPKS
jgi:hypothetical protein